MEGCGDPEPHSSVTLTVSGSVVPIAVAKTNDDGVFFFPGVAAGAYDVRVEVPGLKPSVRTVNAGAQGEVTVDLALEMPPVCPSSTKRIPYQVSPLPHELEIWSTQEGRPQVRFPLLSTICEVAANPFFYSGKMISLRGPIRIGFEDFELSTMDCPDRKVDAIWLEYGRGPKRQPTTWCCGDMVPRDLPSLIQDKEFQVFHRYLTAQKRRRDCPQGDCYRYAVTATLTGAFESVLTVVCPNGEHVCPAGEGFGHFGIFATRLVIRRVENIQTAPRPAQN